jgi:predicted ATPase/class 3 adenylate cyclase/Tfp pilus assembly protein PilF
MDARTLLFTDVVDSTSLVERLGDAQAAQTWGEHDRRARALILRHGGREIDRTDGFFLVFDDPIRAATFALDYHREIADLGLSARVGLHVGAVTLRHNEPNDVARGAKPIEVEGLAKPFAARIMSLAQGGMTLLSAAGRQALGPAPPAGSALASHGHYRLKGVDEPTEVFELGPEAASLFAPPTDTDKAYRVVRIDGSWRPVREVRHNLPAARDTFVGRSAELRALSQRLDTGVRLITLLGPGGTGKTRVALQYAWAWLGEWPGGIHFCDLSEARSLDGVCSAVAAALGVPLGQGDLGAQLGNAIAGRGRCLLILDNFEQVVQPAASTVGRWLDRAGQASFIVTSREQLHLRGETLYAIEPLPLQGDAVALFEVRARAQRDDFRIHDGNRAAVGEVVRLLDGLPLAIELAAARVRVLTPAQLVDRMRDRFSLLAGARGAAARQATLRAAIDWSWQLLTPWEQSAFAQCSVFEGGFTMGAAEAVLDLAHWPQAPPVMDVVQALIDKSLLRTWGGAEAGRLDIDEPHFAMYVSIHEYARERLDLQTQAAAHRRHGRFFATFGTDAAILALTSHGGVRQQRLLRLELDNLVAACRRAVARGDAATAVDTFRATWEVLDLHGPFSLGATLGARVLALPGMDPHARAAACVSHALVSRHLGDKELARARLEEALQLAVDTGDTRCQGIVLGQFALLNMGQSRVVEARESFENALALLQAGGHRREEGLVLGNFANLHTDQGRMEEARVQYEAAIAIHREVGNRRAEGIVLGNLGAFQFDQGQLQQARDAYEAALAVNREVGSRRSEGVVLANLGNLLIHFERTDEALACYEQALAIGREVGHRYNEALVLGHIGIFRQTQGRCDAARECYRRALDIGREIGNQRIQAFAMINMGDLLIGEKSFDAARATLIEPEQIIRHLGDTLELAKLLAMRGLADVGTGDTASGEAALAESLALADALNVGPESELRRCIESLRGSLGA